MKALWRPVHLAAVGRARRAEPLALEAFAAVVGFT